MAYEEHDWADDELITAERLNAMEDGIGAGVNPVAATVAAVSAADATATASTDTVAPAEFSAAVALANETKAKLNSLIANLKAAGIVASE